jgi:hypothetical protein
VNLARIPPENRQLAMSHFDRLCVLDMFHHQVRDSSPVNVARIPPEAAKVTYGPL